MTEKLKPCPFCGGEAKCIEFYGLYHVICCNCHIAGKDCPRRESAVSAWNNRPIEDELREKIEKLEAENARLQRKLNESIDDNYKNAWKIQQQAERGAKFAQKENKRLREALELIVKSNFYFARGEEDKQLSRVCEIARNALNGNEK